jgi:hypothetical protein
MINRKRIIYAFLALLILGLAWYGVLYWRSRPSKPNVPIAVFGSQQTLDAFLSASDVTAQRLHYRRAFPQNPWRLDSYDRDALIPVSAKQAQTIQQLFAQESSYGWRFAKMCAPDYGVLLTARSNQATVRVALCFECYILGVYDSADDTAKPVNRENDFVSPASRTLVSLAKQLFPNDSAIQSLK